MWLGAHISTSDGLSEAPVTGRKIGCDVIQIFSKSPQMWMGPPIVPEAAEGFAEAVRREEIRTTAIHHAYLTNLASPKPPMLQRSRAAFVDELRRAAVLGVDQVIFHPGAHLGSGVETGLARIAEGVNWALAEIPECRARVLFENSAGQGTTLCSRLEELTLLLDRIAERPRVGVALDTCHLFAAGIEFRTEETYGALVDRVRASVGIEEVRAFHLNDTKADLGSHLDRHENIGRGKLGTDGFRWLLNDPRWGSVPGYLETPLDDNGYAAYEADLKTLRSLETPRRAALPPSRPPGRAPTSPRRRR